MSLISRLSGWDNKSLTTGLDLFCWTVVGKIGYMRLYMGFSFLCLIWVLVQVLCIDPNKIWMGGLKSMVFILKDLNTQYYASMYRCILSMLFKYGAHLMAINPSSTPTPIVADSSPMGLHGNEWTRRLDQKWIFFYFIFIYFFI